MRSTKRPSETGLIKKICGTAMLSAVLAAAPAQATWLSIDNSDRLNDSIYGILQQSAALSHPASAKTHSTAANSTGTAAVSKRPPTPCP